MKNDGRKIEDPIVVRIVELMEEKGLSDKEFSYRLGVGNGTLSHWKYSHRTTYLQYINPICDILETTPTYLFQGIRTKEEESLTKEEMEVIRNFRKLENKGQECVKMMMNLLVEKEEYELEEKTLL